MIILGINSSHNATACLLKDGKILACISEERLTGVKNQAGIPVLSIKECLRIAGLRIDDIDYLVLNFKDPKYHLGFSVFGGEKGKITSIPNLNLFQRIISLFWRLKEQLLVSIPPSKYILDNFLSFIYKYLVNPKLEKELLFEIESKLGIPSSKVISADHHICHILSAYYSSPHQKSKPMLIFTLDSMGDGVCATVNIAKNGKIQRIATSPAGASIGDLYTQTTAYLGMKLGEHEYKVMGLAPYANYEHFQSVLDKLKDCVLVKDDLTFETKVHSHMFYKILPKIYAYERFDNIAGALQKFTEDILCSWIKMAVDKTGIRDITCAGGVFMNVKANQKILELDEVNSLFVMPSASDESTAIGTAYWGYTQSLIKNPNLPKIEPLADLYLGGGFNDEDIKKTLEDKRYKKFKVSRPKDIEAKIAKLLSEGQIVARFSGRMEWGARALGNRSILAHPSRLEVISLINAQIKNRDFWMPFAPSILEEDERKYFVNRKKMLAPYMIVTFNTTSEGKDKFKASMHQSDHTLRPQVVYKQWNPGYYKLISEFKKLTGIGGVLNTSFNLHGYPIVYTPDDALLVFEKSGLKFLELGSFLVSKE